MSEKRSSPAIRAKHWFGSKTGDSKLGRAVVGKFAGDAGNDIIFALKNAALKYEGKVKSKEVKQWFFRLAIKVGMLLEEGKIPPSRAGSLRPLLLQLASDLLVNIDRVKNGASADFAKLSDSWLSLGTATAGVLSSHITDKHVERTLDICAFFGERGFLEALFTMSEFVVERETIYRAIQSLTADIDLEEELRVGEPCAAKECGESRLPETSTFQGSRFCRAHHIDEWERLQDKAVSLVTFVNDYTHRRVLFEYMSEHGHDSILRLYLDLQNFRNVSNRATLQGRAEVILTKFFGPCAPSPVTCISESDLMPIEAAIAEQTVRATMFSSISSKVETILNSQFEQFTSSDTYSNYLHQLKLPGQTSDNDIACGSLEFVQSADEEEVIN